MNIFDVLIVQPIFNLLIGLYSIIPGGDFGISIIIFTIFVRWAMWPLVKKQLHQTRMMRKLQPELKKIKKNAKGNKQLEGMQMMELYKENGVSPFRSIGILIIQLPIFIALFQVIRILTQHRDQIADYTYGFMKNIGPIKDIIASPNNFNEHLFGFINLSEQAFSSGKIVPVLVVLALLAALMQYLLSKQTMPAPEQKKRLRDILKEAGEGKQADQTEMNAAVMGKMIKVLPIFMFFIMISLPSALTLYYTVSSAVAYFQQRHILKQDEQELSQIASAPSKNTKTAKSNVSTREKQAKPAVVTKQPAAKKTPATKKPSPKKPAPKNTAKKAPTDESTVIRIKAKD